LRPKTRREACGRLEPAPLPRSLRRRRPAPARCWWGSTARQPSISTCWCEASAIGWVSFAWPITASLSATRTSSGRACGPNKDVPGGRSRAGETSEVQVTASTRASAASSSSRAFLILDHSTSLPWPRRTARCALPGAVELARSPRRVRDPRQRRRASARGVSTAEPSSTSPGGGRRPRRRSSPRACPKASVPPRPGPLPA
jgi:hypothetical protein